MTKLKILPLSILLIIGFLFSCERGISNQDQKVVLKGNISLSKSSKVRLSNIPIPLEKEWSNGIDITGISTTVDSTGKFEFNFKIAKPDFYRLDYGRNNTVLYLEPKDSVFISIDSLPKFGGDKKMLNQFLQEHKLELDKTENYILNNLASLYALNETEFHKELDSIKTNLIEQADSFLESTNNVPLAYKDRVIANNEYLVNYYKLLYPLGYKSITRNKANLSENFYEELSIGLNNPKFLNSKRFVNYLDKYVEIMASGEFKYERYDVKPLEKIQARYNTIKALSVDQEIKDYLFEQHFKLCNEYYSPKHWKTILDDFLESNDNSELTNKILKTYEASLAVRQEPDEIKVYKKIEDIELDVHVFYPSNHQRNDDKAVFLFFHGGGWSLGLPENGYKNCKKMAEKGIVAISVEYRLIDVHGNTIQKGLEDAKSAIRWVRANASELGIDPNKVVATGFSAGAHLAATTAIIDDYVSNDNSGFSSEPNLVITQSSNYIADGDFFMGVSKGQAQSVSLLQNVKKDLPPFLSLHASNDYLDPVYTFYQFKSKMEEYENDFQFRVFEGVDHFFSDREAKKEVDSLINEFLERRGYFPILKD